MTWNVITKLSTHYGDVIMGPIASQITSLANNLIRCRSKKTSKLRVTGLCTGNSPETGELSEQRASNAENVSIWWRHHGSRSFVSGNLQQFYWISSESIPIVLFSPIVINARFLGKLSSFAIVFPNIYILSSFATKRGIVRNYRNNSMAALVLGPVVATT